MLLLSVFDGNIPRKDRDYNPILETLEVKDDSLPTTRILRSLECVMDDEKKDEDYKEVR